ncbi:SDR family NAD(P)-dependent oxidoreductase [Cesiribacter sp. SM1]|uniref:SDR family NAD(P)-dependent oxidoreductase n=1 Tax=Cesiribacter sp. SM1 TaxID=2861196 RepID=UPI001CD68EA4|nr:SDR family oxidoreductase [Cesiribacter sp. SM1]
MFSLTNKTAIVTGGGSGIGKAISQLFARQGAEVFVLELNEDSAHAVVQSIQQAGGRAHAVACNVASQKEVADAFHKIYLQTGRLDILVNNAGIAHIGNVLTTSEDDFDKIYAVNVKGVYNCLKAGVEKMLASGGGVILNLASVASSVGLQDRFAYSTSKGAVLTMTLSVAKDFVDKNIRCNCIAPGRVHTPFVDGFLQKNYPGREQEMFEKLSKTQPIGRMGTPEEMASLALFLCSDEASFITGSNYPIDGGFVTLNT